jgi:5-methylcytosine-specific restriction endonuclease McrA
MIDDFSIKNREKLRWHVVCKACYSAYRRRHYIQNKSKYIAKAHVWNKKQGKVLANYLFEKLTQSECVDCGEKDILVLEFDHISNKKLGIAQMYRNRFSLAALEEELKKCVVRCANCHRRKTAIETKFWRYKMLQY